MSRIWSFLWPHCLLEFFIALLATHGLTISAIQPVDPASNQLPKWAANLQNEHQIVTSFLGSPAPSLTASVTTHPLNGPILLQDTNFIEVLAHFDRERIPERVVHARGAGAHGVFKVTHDITRYTKADLFSEIGKETEIFIRFSTVGGELGSADTVNDPRGFAIKFYTEKGNWDLVGNNLPVFPIRDPILFPSLIHTRKRNPQTHLPDKNMFWDFIALRPESTHHTMMLFSDLGIPKSHRTMNGFGVHTFKLINSKGEIHFVKFHHISLQGVHNFFWDEAIRISGQDPDYYIRDLYNAIETGNFPSWQMFIQIMTPLQLQANNFTGVFDPVQIWPEEEFPLIPVGIFTLNRNPKNYFAEVEQVAFDPGNLIPGIGFSPDRLLHGRSFSYTDTQRYRLGSNFLNIPINVARNVKSGIHNYMRDGQHCLTNQFDGPNYFPNSFNGPKIVFESTSSLNGDEIHGKVGRFDSGPVGDNFSQAKQFYLKLKQDEKDRLVSNIIRHLKFASKSVQESVLTKIFANVHPELYKQVKLGLYLEHSIIFQNE